MPESAFISLETPRLLIRHFRDSDLEPFLAYRNDPNVARYQGWSAPYARESALDFIAGMVDKQPAPGEWLQLALESKETGAVLGDVAFHIMESDPRQAYLGYTLSRAAWGQGFAMEAVRRLLDYLFGELNLHRIVAECDVENTASLRLLERTGFRREAHLVENVWFKGGYGSEFHYAMLQREWNGKK
ncbi:MAG: N-acetyltransferase [Chloroflexi bacterium]|nr:MAG: N-acetyltransferase [Chloroflexota bacterium]